MGFLKGKKKSSGQSHNNFLEMLEEVTLKIDQMRATNEEIKKQRQTSHHSKRTKHQKL